MRSILLLTGINLMMITVAIEARSELILCNHTSWWLSSVIIHNQESASHSILPGECKSIVESPLDVNEEYYATAAIPRVYEEESDWEMKTDHGLCVRDGRYIFFKTGEAAPCKDRYRSLFDYLRIVPNSTEFVLDLYDDQEFSLKEARIAGAQRFLNAQDFDVGSVDGINGVRTKRGLAGYEKRHGLGRDGLVTPELIEAMAEIQRDTFESATLEVERFRH